MKRAAVQQRPASHSDTQTASHLDLQVSPPERPAVGAEAVITMSRLNNRHAASLRRLGTNEVQDVRAAP